MGFATADRSLKTRRQMLAGAAAATVAVPAFAGGRADASPEIHPGLARAIDRLLYALESARKDWDHANATGNRLDRQLADKAEYCVRTEMMNRVVQAWYTVAGDAGGWYEDRTLPPFQYRGLTFSMKFPPARSYPFKDQEHNDPEYNTNFAEEPNLFIADSRGRLVMRGYGEGAIPDSQFNA